MVSECRRYIFGCFDVLPRNIRSWIKIHQLILLEEMPENFEHSKSFSKKIFPILSWWCGGRVPGNLSEGPKFESSLNFHG